MTKHEAMELVDELAELFRSLSSQFLSEECRAWIFTHPELATDFIPELDLYDSTIAGYGSWGKKIFRWDEQRIKKCSEDIRLGFFEIHPEYLRFANEIDSERTPKLYARLRNLDRMRTVLTQLIPYLSEELQNQNE